ncbi:tryptophan 7-halogenase [Pseudoalteromonas haloplanktis]|uniref:Tryptophan 7-halogenase n=1 Tax=Pseudoalteromonas haloplanktis TaxID=228 RepID=A0ABU1BB60_PSEHA|nr:tryptophan 7-halogenase [Pseudoalteromonas haloplanktis]MDQ9091725.1 tryptophan 7-halogenase [Pseudoalteromonas haloplanktis]
MQLTQQPITKIVIAGGGTAGWLAAATLSYALKKQAVEITLIESDEIGTIGVGEATIPPLIAILESIGIDLADFIKHTQATFKLGIQFADWYNKGEAYFHPFGTLGRNIDGHDFYQCWLKAAAEGDSTPLMAHSPEAILAQHNKFFIPHEAHNTALGRARFALHLDAGLMARYLRRYAQNNGVKRIEGVITDVHQDNTGNISHLHVNQQYVTGEFFIDCSGFKGLLIEQTLHAGFDDWSDYLPCNRAVTVQTTHSKTISPYTVAKAQNAGWSWHIPLQHRMGNGYVFCDKYCTDQQAIDTLLANVTGELLTHPKVIAFKTGVRKQAWLKNCLSLGLAQGFIEPLESTAIHLVSKSLALFIKMFPDNSDTNQVIIDEFNRRIHQDYLEIRDFLVLHYCTTARSDTEFWQRCASMAIPQSLQQKLAIFKVAGTLTPAAEQLFQPTSWYAVLNGMQVMPSRYNPVLDSLDSNKLIQSLHQGSEAIAQAALTQPSHADFITRFCDAKEIYQKSA